MFVKRLSKKNPPGLRGTFLRFVFYFLSTKSSSKSRRGAKKVVKIIAFVNHEVPIQCLKKDQIFIFRNRRIKDFRKKENRLTGVSSSPSHTRLPVGRGRSTLAIIDGAIFIDGDVSNRRQIPGVFSDYC